MDIDTDGPRLDSCNQAPDVMDTSLDFSHDDKAKGKELLRDARPETPALQDTRQTFEQPREEDAMSKLSSLIGKISACVSVAR